MNLPFSSWSLAKPADFVVAEGGSAPSATRACGCCSARRASPQRIKTWKSSKDPRYAAKKLLIEHLYAIADREVTPEAGDPEVVFCVDELGPLNLQPRPGRQWAAVSGKSKEPGRAPRPRMRATCTRTVGVRHLIAAYELGEDKLYGHVRRQRRPGRGLGQGEQRRDRLYADEFILVEPNRGAVHGAAVLRARRHLRH
jgi:hypothetical protein